MDEIYNMDIYLKRMAATLSDKCWWVESMPPEIDTVVDYGCAQGDLGVFLEKNNPGRFYYIGIDNSPAMLALIERNRARYFGESRAAFYESISGIADRCDTSRSVLVLNSVMHEVFSYLTEAEQEALLADMFGAGFRYIAIRDMHMPRLERTPYDVREALGAIGRSASASMWEDYCAYLDGARRQRGERWDSVALRVAEFLLKYKYVDNWDREKKETYYWDWLEMTERFWKKAGYRVAFDLTFHIPFLRNQIRNDFGFDFPVDTHRKVLLTRDA